MITKAETILKNAKTRSMVIKKPKFGFMIKFFNEYVFIVAFGKARKK